MKGQKYVVPSSVFPEDHNLAILGHELGNVLHGLLGMTELLGESGLTTEQRRWLRAIENSGKQMELLIRSVWSARNAGGMFRTPQSMRIDGIKMLESVVTSHTPGALSRHNSLLLVVHPDLPGYWNLDACMVRQLLDNLVGNAVKFTRKGNIVVEAAPVTLKGRPGQSIQFRISDTGAGFTPSAAAEIFGAYHRCEHSKEEDTGNRGLGLHICKTIVHALGGQITGACRNGGGSRFEVVLPGASCRSEAQPGLPRSRLLRRVHCQLKLGNDLRRSVASSLARLGVSFSDQAVDVSDDCLALLVSEAPQQRSNAPPSLVLAPCAQSGIAPERKILEAPLLESSLGSLLLQITLEWRSLALRNERPGSAPIPR